jgi:hypothetical protein
MGRTIHGKRTKGGSTAKLTHNCCIFGIMGGTASTIGVPNSHRGEVSRRASQKALCIQDCILGHKYLKDHGILGCNPQAGGVGNMWRNRHYSHRFGPTPAGDGSAHGSRGQKSELLGAPHPCCSIFNANHAKIEYNNLTTTYTSPTQDDPLWVEVNSRFDGTLVNLWVPSTIVLDAGNTIYGVLKGPGAQDSFIKIEYDPSGQSPGQMFSELDYAYVSPNHCGRLNVSFGTVTPICQRSV